MGNQNELYVKSHIHLNKKLTIIENEEKLLKNELLYLLYEIYGKIGNIEKPLERINKIVQMLGKTPISFALYNLFQREVSHKSVKLYELLYYLNASHITPLFSKIYIDNTNSICLLDNIKAIYPSSETIKMFMFPDKNYRDICLSHSYLNSAELRRKIYIAKSLYQKENYSESIQLFQNIKHEMQPISKYSKLYMFDQIAHYLYKAYLKQNDYRNCIDLYLESYFINQNICKKLNLRKIIDAFENDQLGEYFSHVSYPIITYIYHGISWETYVAYDNYIFSLGLLRASDMSYEVNANDIPLLVKFWSDVCVPDIVYHSIHFESSEELENERIAICQRLIQIDPKNAEKYTTEIGDITQKSMIRKGIRQIEESKIYVDINGIIKSSEKTLIENYNRFKEFSSFSDQEEVAFFDFSESLLKSVLGDKGISNDTTPKSKSEEIQYKPWVKVEPGFKLFVELFLDIRDRFVSSNEYGLDSYLSVRIRHGTLLGHLRRQFESVNLITQKEDSKGGAYKENEYWSQKLEDISDESHHAIQESFKELSANIDQIIVNLKDYFLQVKTEKKNPRGLFDYGFYNIELHHYYKKHISKSMTYDEFLAAIFDYLWARTEKNLILIRDVINRYLQTEILNFLNHFEEKIKKSISQ